jgi:hypothetical protein
MWFPGIDPPENPHADEIATLLDERDHVWHLLCEAEDAADPEAIKAYRARITEIDREVDYIASGERDEDLRAEAMERT